MNPLICMSVGSVMSLIGLYGAFYIKPYKSNE